MAHRDTSPTLRRHHRTRPVAQWRRTPAADLLRFGGQTAPEIQVSAFVLPEMNPNGWERDSAVIFPFLLTIDEAFDVQGRVERRAGGVQMALEIHAYDRRRKEWVAFDCPMELQAPAYRYAGQEYLRTQGGAYACGKGRN